MPRHWRLSVRIVASSVSITLMSPTPRPSCFRVFRISARSGATRLFETRRSLLTEIGIGAGALRGIHGIRRAHVEDRGQHRNERLADLGQLLLRQRAVVELPLLHALFDDARDESADAARRRL